MLILNLVSRLCWLRLALGEMLRNKGTFRSGFFRRRKIFLFLLVFILIVTYGFSPLPVSSQSSGTVKYLFKVDDEGSTFVNILYYASQDQGSAWILVPKFSPWINRTLKGKVTEWSLLDSYELAGFENPFYEALWFSFKSTGGEFEISIQYNHSLAAMIIEPNGIFFSPQIGFEKGNKAEITVVFPKGFIINRNEAVAFGSNSTYPPSSIDQNENLLSFNIPEKENLLRVEVGFKTRDQSTDLIKLHSGIFNFETPSRYREYAWRILGLYNETYDDLVNLFNVTLENAQVRFFLPDFNSLLEIGGYVPFSSEKLGDIHLNIMYTRAVEGQIEVIALHELVHHFLWKAGISPQKLLWFHEGMAQYVSLEIGNKIGYEGSLMMKQQLHTWISQVKRRFGDNLGFIQDWSPTYSPQDVGSCYAAAYYVVSELAQQRGGLDYYQRFFKALKGQKIEDNVDLAYYLSLAAGESVADILNRWGFDIPDLYVYSPLLNEAKSLIRDVSRLFEPYRSIAEILYKNAMLNADQENEDKMRLYLIFAVLVAKLAPILTLITVTMFIYCLLLWILKTKKVFSDYSEVRASRMRFNLLRDSILTSSYRLLP